jgi:hypothetical protein
MSPWATVDSEPRTEPVDAEIVEEETVDGVAVLENDSALTPVRRAASELAATASPAVQTAAAAATGFVAGAATLALARRRATRKLARTSVRRRAADALPIVGTRSFLIDIHMIRPE